MVRQLIIRFALAALALGAVLALAPAQAADRVALVIGNSRYQHAADLANPSNDATDVAAALRAIGFTVIEGRDLDRRAMEDKVRAFSRSLDGASLALFFYAGHGMQVDGHNYLLPVDAALARAGDLLLETVDLDLVMSQMDATKRVNLVFLDACRDNPLARSFAPRLATRSLSVGQGLASVRSAIGTLIAYATQPDNVALDGSGRNSPFTAALLRHIATPGLEISALMKKVRADVVAATRERQVPWDHSSLIGDVVLVKAAPGADPAAAQPAAPAPARPSVLSRSAQHQAIIARLGRPLTPAVTRMAAEIGRLAFSPDSRLLAAALGDGRLELREVDSNRVLRTLSVATTTPDAVAFSVDGALLATAADQVITLWDVGSGRVVRRLTGHRGHIHTLAFLPDGVSLVAADNRGSIRQWDIQDGRAKARLGDRGTPGHLAAVAPDGRTVAWSGTDRALTLWDVGTRRVVHRLHGHSDLIVTAAFSPDSRLIASGANDATVRVWNPDSGSLLHTLAGHQDRVSVLALSPQGDWLASGAADGTLRLWDLQTGRPIRALDHAIFVSALAISPDGRWLASGDGEQRLRLWPVGADQTARP